MVKATVDGKRKLLSLDVDKDIINADDKEMLQDLIVAAVNKANENMNPKFNNICKR
jgi:DNA-binding protein YbaB